MSEGAAIVFYSLSQKFLDRKEDIPAQAKQVVYYSLAIGHHVGVIDCLKKVLEWPQDVYAQWLNKLAPGEARNKLAGALRWGEIMIDAMHVPMLDAALAAGQAQMTPDELEWTSRLRQILADIAAEPAIYLMVRQR